MGSLNAVTGDRIYLTNDRGFAGLPGIAILSLASLP
jgi:hypothetical protein